MNEHRNTEERQKMMAHETRHPVQPYMVTGQCDKPDEEYGSISCGGELKYTGKILHNLTPPLFEHICQRCGVTHSFETKYPHVTYEALK